MDLSVGVGLFKVLLIRWSLAKSRLRYFIIISEEVTCTFSLGKCSELTIVLKFVIPAHSKAFLLN